MGLNRPLHDALAGPGVGGDADLDLLRSELERRIEAQTEALRKANEEAERFAYVASHDLRAPLRALMTIPEWLRETLVDSYGEVLPEIEEDLAELEVQSRRMDALLGDLLTYSRIGRSGDPETIADPAGLIRRAIDTLKMPAGFSVSVGPMGGIVCVPSEFALAMRSLISNAVKHHDRDRGKIRIEARSLGDSVEFAVSDDGPGIPLAFADRVFEMFTTLKPRDEVEGSGMGLAMVSKIVRCAGGTVILGETVGRGARFLLTFPAADPDGRT